MFSVRIVTTDHYMAPPLRGLDVQYADQRGAEVKKVPVVRIFGATPAGNVLSQAGLEIIFGTYSSSGASGLNFSLVLTPVALVLK